MLQRLSRLSETKDIEKVFKLGKASYNNFIGIKSIKNQLTYSRFAVLTGNKTSKKAVTRNKLKRRIRYAIKKNINNIKPGFDNIIITKSQIVDCKYKDLEEILIFHLNRLGLIYEKKNKKS